LLYALANHVKHIWATDLYTEDSLWPTARASDINAFIRGNPRIPTEVDRISAKNMDMREIEFGDNSFDFAYSSSVVEHIGGWDEFRRHLSEVRRVLKPGGVYVLTTDISYGKTIEAPGNYKFDEDGLQWWLQESGMAYEPVIDCRIAHNYINAPLPTALMAWIAADDGRVRNELFNRLLQVQMLAGRYPYSSVVLVMKKAPTDRPAVEFTGLAETKAFLAEAQQWVEGMFEESDLRPHPAPYVPVERRKDMWATDYMWLGDRPRTIRIRITTNGPGRVAFAVNRTHTDRSWAPVVDVPPRTETTSGFIEVETNLSCQRDWNYAVYGYAVDGLELQEVQVLIEDARSFGAADGIAAV
jgi:SAM-dependent methyltransferase